MTLERRAVQISTDSITMAGDLSMPEAAPRGVVLFAHGTGSSRLSPRNRFVAEVLVKACFATLLMDLLTADEEAEEAATGHLRFDIDLLAGRLEHATRWLQRQPSVAELPAGYFGASTGAAAALVAAARDPDAVAAIVSRGGRPDLAGEALSAVKAPTLLIVGGNDQLVLDLNRRALEALKVPKKLEIVPGASHLFPEPGALETVARLAANWFADHMTRRAPP